MRQRVAMTVLACLMLAGCAGIKLDEKRAASLRLATDAGWQRLDLDAGTFVLAAFSPPGLRQTDTLTIYIEGDGLAWMDATMPSLDPTPLDPLALRLALRDASDKAVYLARPCQYVTGEDRRGCEKKYWTSHRFSPEVVAAGNLAVSRMKARHGANKITLVGYSGGGAVAALVAARRDDVALLITVAGNLDHAAWTSSHRLSPLSGSLNPADAWRALQEVPQRHYIGGRDTIVGEGVARAYAARFEKNKAPPITLIPEFDHHCCWDDIWPGIVNSRFGAIQPDDNRALLKD